MEVISNSKIQVKVIGLGGGGGSIVSRIAQRETLNVEFLAINTDAQALHLLNKNVKALRIGDERLKGFGTGMNARLAYEIAENSKARIEEFAKGADLAFFVATLGGGTGSGVFPFIADLFQDKEALTIGIATTPFLFEGGAKRSLAEETIEKVRGGVDSLILISNDRVLKSVDQFTNLKDAFRLIDNTIIEGIRGMVDLIYTPGIVNIDFADLRTIIKKSGLGMVGVGSANGKNGAKEAALEAISSPFLDLSVSGAKGVVFNVAGGENLALSEVHDAAKVITQHIDKEAAVIFGASCDPLLKSRVKTTVVATGLTQENSKIHYTSHIRLTGSHLLKGPTPFVAQI